MFAVGIVLPPIAMMLNRSFTASTKVGAAAVIDYAVAHPAVHTVELVLGPVGGVLALLGVIGAARLSLSSARG